MSKRKGRKLVKRKGHQRMWSLKSLNSGPVKQIMPSAFGRSVFDPWLEQKFPGISPHVNTMGRKEALSRRVSIMLADVSKDAFIVVLEIQSRCVRLYYNAGKTKWFFMRKTQDSVELSMSYPTRLIAERVWNNGEVVFDVKDAHKLVPA